ncbi:ABC transporter substrate-binding protein [Comamonas serinivorans]|uniref:ABC transporter substrate-binding protein n=1 Tax=Comamonas serinivorans TaxID=1082851 RepID=A0A1Y0EIP5_9BURK|nr:tripartite tricarboxylate transporter substrate binding protein [Comamonas serinivorans]ARU03330.1 ABC transporter substrate-binding protein [Comamonas serinivorans]
MQRRHLLQALAASALPLSASLARADAGPVRLIVPFGAGGVTDLTGRTYGEYMGRAMGQSFIVENKPGAGATIGANFVVKAKPDGQTLLLGTNVTHAINPFLMKAFPYDPLKDLQAVGLFGHNGNVLVVRKDYPVDSFPAFVERAQRMKDEMTYASASIGSSAHMASELLRQSVPGGLAYRHIPFAGPSEAMSALMGGHVDFCFLNIGAAISQVQGNKVKGLAVTTRKRAASLPQIPTIAESGVPGFEVVGWMAAFVPSGTPAARVTALNAALNQVQQDAGLMKILANAAIDPEPWTPAQTTEFVKAEYAKWKRVIEKAGLEKV